MKPRSYFDDFDIDVWKSDPLVTILSPATRGIWFEILCDMRRLPGHRGVITGTRETLARHGRCPESELDRALEEIKFHHTADVIERHGIVTLINRRMNRQAGVRESQRKRKHKERCHSSCHSSVTQLSHGTEKPGRNPPTPPIDLIDRKAIDSQFSQSINGQLTKLTIQPEALNRIALDIIANKHGWAYDNCKVQPSQFPFRKSLASVLSEYVGRVSESQVHSAWQEAITRTHCAAVDGMVNDPPRYAIQCWREAIVKSTNHNYENVS